MILSLVISFSLIIKLLIFLRVRLPLTLVDGRALTLGRLFTLEFVSIREPGLV